MQEQKIIKLIIPDDVPVKDCLGKMVKINDKWITLLDLYGGDLKTDELYFTSAAFDYFVRNADKFNLREIVEGRMQ